MSVKTKEQETNINDRLDNILHKFKKIKSSNNKKFDKVDAWLEKEANIYLNEIKNKKTKRFKYKRGTIVKINFGVNPGSELCHTHFAIVLNNDDNISKDTIIVVPLTSKPGIGRIPLNKLITEEVIKSIQKKWLNNPSSDEKDTEKIIDLINEYKKYTEFSYAIISQIRAVSKSRIIFSDNKFDIINKAKCSATILEEIDNAIIKTITGAKLLNLATEKIKINKNSEN